MTALERRGSLPPSLAALRPRRVELGLIFLIAVVVVAAYGLASLGQSSSVPANIGPFLAWMLGLFFFVHLAVRRFAPAADPVIVPMALLLNGLGYVMIARLGGDVDGGGDLAGLQSVWTAVGIGLFVATLILIPRARMLAQYRYLFGLGGIALLALPLVPGIGIELNGARIWVSIGPVNFQPGEFAKIALAIFFASYLVDAGELIKNRLELRDLVPIGAAWAASVGVMVLERDLGSSMLLFALFVVMMWMASGRTMFLGLGAAMFAAGGVVAFQLFSHVERRIDAWLNPWADPQDSGFQIIQATYSMAEGGLTGTGLGRGEPDRVPFAETDFIFAALGEELGLAGTAAVLMAFLVLIGSGLRIAIRATRPFEILLAVGLTTLVAVQAFIIMGGVVRLIPLTGITLPFVSYGGSALVSNYIVLALLVRLSHEQRVAATKEPTP
ncbi:MAG: FtsW/RodA/SpoVE family cell cycle protein [Acidimicrobiales bacterium]|nr:FtsW/RodA/SpoVE family cell cycle protein [Acidimicrobiales bacterium]